ncbi:nucleotidyltransferase domain-containing protein [Methylobacterium nodulans]|uniref:Polymerase nucleotidyl transferase domain-containing protein n=1 Tax=Methylobacterium nodulans (strain LMG 21967 / CNCM I-2342 / ORS 2060) TaxID=460265 RepID=B8IE03_METNO|nr:nucleotidyltransferase domain-containing protein [Methylobacterium nodulans]ACL57549.1 hypothetical protein Mnod_2586 [Methylobacterium nodulans ORS 2060]
MTEDAHAIVRILNQWADEGGTCLQRIYLFGSTVRGDPNPGDIDVRIFKDRDVQPEDAAGIMWWLNQEATDFPELRQRLPRTLSMILWNNADADPFIIRGAADPIYTEGRVICVLTPRVKP